jgi:hypothetical protein
MKLAWLGIVALLVVVLWIAMRARHHQSTQVNATLSTPSRPPDPKVYAEMRDLALGGSRAKFGLGPGLKPTQPFAVLMDWRLRAGSATVVAIVDGTASVYLSNGGGFIGGGQSHESIRQAAKRTVEAADEVQDLMHSTTTYPMAATGEVNFYVLTDVGIFTAIVSEKDLRDHRSPFSKLGDSAQDIVTQYGLIQESN